MELLVLKHKSKYLRMLDDNYQLVEMNKASVFPLTESKKVEDILAQLSSELIGLEIRILELVEKPYAT